MTHLCDHILGFEVIERDLCVHKPSSLLANLTSKDLELVYLVLKEGSPPA